MDIFEQDPVDLDNIKTKDFPFSLLGEIKQKNFDISRATVLRRRIHHEAQGENNEFQTQEKILEFFKFIGMEDKNVYKFDKTGIVFVIQGEHPTLKLQKEQIIAIRADMDGLKMPDQSGAPYKSQTEYCHACGHDGHVACLAAAGEYIFRNRKQIPSNFTIRLLFQPDQEVLSGAQIMVEEGCLLRDLSITPLQQAPKSWKKEDLIDEIYGMHDAANVPMNTIRTIVGPTQSGYVGYEIRIQGKGGHATLPKEYIDPIYAATQVYVALDDLAKTYIEQRKFLFKICVLNGGTASNVVTDEVFMKGSFRYLDYQYEVELQKFIKLAHEVAIQNNCTAEFQIIDPILPITTNHPGPNQNIVDALQQLLGEKGVNSIGLPKSGSEDFSFYTELIPGGFFYMGLGEVSGFVAHAPNFNFNDQLIPFAALAWIQIIEKSINMTIF